MYDREIHEAEGALEYSFWKLKALAGIFSVMSGAGDIELKTENYYGISLILGGEVDNMEKQTEIIAQKIRNSVS